MIPRAILLGDCGKEVAEWLSMCEHLQNRRCSWFQSRGSMIVRLFVIWLLVRPKDSLPQRQA